MHFTIAGVAFCFCRFCCLWCRWWFNL